MKIEKENFIKRIVSAAMAAVMIVTPVVVSAKTDVPGFAISASAASAVNMSKCTVTVASSVAYTGKALTPAVTVKNGKTTLKKGKHYTVKYSANTNMGTASVTVTAIKGSGFTGSKTVKFNIVPGKPVVKASSNSDSVTLTWAAVKGATKYDVYSYNTSNKKYTKLKTVTATKYTVSKLTAGKDYSYAVKAYAVKGNKTYTGAMSDVKKVATAPSKPGTPTAKAKSATEVTLSWKKVSGATGYNVYSYNASTKKYTLLLTTTSVSATVKKLKAATAYKLCVSAYRTASGTKYEGAKSAQVSITTLPAKVANVKAATTDTSITLTWDKAAGATGYYVYSYNTFTKKYTKIATVKSPAVTVKDLKKGTKYSFAVCAYMTSGSTTVTGEKSAVITATTTESAKASLEKAQKIFRSGTFDVVYSMNLKDLGMGDMDGMEDFLVDDNISVETFAKNGDSSMKMTIRTYVFTANLSMLYLKKQDTTYTFMEVIGTKSYETSKGVDDLLDTDALVNDMFAPKMAQGETVKEGTKKIGTKTYKTASYKAENKTEVTYCFYNSELKYIETKEADGSVSRVEISKLSATVPDSAVSLPKDFPKGYEKM